MGDSDLTAGPRAARVWCLPRSCKAGAALCPINWRTWPIPTCLLLCCHMHLGRRQIAQASSANTVALRPVERRLPGGRARRPAGAAQEPSVPGPQRPRLAFDACPAPGAKSLFYGNLPPSVVCVTSVRCTDVATHVLFGRRQMPAPEMGAGFQGQHLDPWLGRVPVCAAPVKCPLETLYD